jgi:hypothetical protein
MALEVVESEFCMEGCKDRIERLKLKNLHC